MEVEVSQIIKEWNKERVQKFKGLIIKIAWKSELEKTITVRRKVWPFGVEKIFSVHSPSIQKIEILRQFKVRKKSLKYIRDLTWKAAKLKEIKEDEKKVKREKELKKEKKVVEKIEKGIPIE
jgi:large subunit ribosomal protein L19